MIVFIYGTTGELIKIAPVMRALAERGIAFRQWVTGQQATQLDELTRHLELPPIDRWIGASKEAADLKRIAELPKWASTIAVRVVRHRRLLRRELRDDGNPPLVVVHGDTMTTLYGALIGRLLGARVAHIEAGLRSFDLLHPFPEELSRRLTSRAAHLHYAPGQWAANNLGSREGVVDTITNTLRDSIDLMKDEAPIEVEGSAFGIASIHRQELLGNRRLFRQTMEMLSAAAVSRRILFIEHAITIEAMRSQGLYDEYRASALVRTPRLPYFEFTALLRSALYLFTDSGGGQEETYYLDIPCLVHRKRTERREGLEENVLLSGYDLDRCRAFLSDPSSYRRVNPLPGARPSDIIVADLIARGHAS